MKRRSERHSDAVRLRGMGYSFAEMSERLKVSKSTAALWTRTVALSGRAKTRLAMRRELGRLHARKKRALLVRTALSHAERVAYDDVRNLRMNATFFRLLSSLLYWCEGEKSNDDSTLLFANSDPKLVHLYLRSLRSGFPLDESKFRVCVHLHEYHDKQEMVRFWSKVTGIPLRQFIKPYFKAHTGVRKKSDYRGCASVRYYDAGLARLVQAYARALVH